MSKLTLLTPDEKAFVANAVAEAERIAGKKLNLPNKHIVINRAKEQIYAQRYASHPQPDPEDSSHEAEFVWSKPKPFRR